MNQLATKIAFVILIVALWTASLEISFVVSVIVLLLNFRTKISREAFLFISVLSILIVIGMFGLFILENRAYDFIKDFVYFLRPITVLLAAYYSVRNLKRKTDFFDLIVLTGFAFATVHLVHIALKILSVGTNLSEFRNYFGRRNHVELVALFIIICIKDLPIKRTRFKIIYQFFVLCLTLSFIAYFSRTMFVVLLAMILAYRGYFKLDVRGTIALISLIVVGGLFAFFIANYEPAEGDDGPLTSFLLKMKNSYTEAFKPIEIDKYQNDRRELWKVWRAFEANLVIDEVDRGGLWFTGKGFGSTVDVGFQIKLDGERIRHLPTVHNGLAYVYMKTGAIGLLVYFVIIALLYIQYFLPITRMGPNSLNHILAATAFYVFVSSMVVTGIFKPYDMAILLIGGVFALKQYYYLESRNTRD